MQIFVRILTGKLTARDVAPIDKIGEVKDGIQLKLRPLIFAGNCLMMETQLIQKVSLMTPCSVVTELNKHGFAMLSCV